MSAPDPQTVLLPASAAQRRLWLVDRMDPGLPTYDVPWTVRLDGAVDPAALAAALTAVVDRHEALRTTLQPATGDDALLQVVAPPRGPVALPVRDLRSAGASEDDLWAAVRPHVERASRRRFDLTRGPLVAAELLTVTDTLHVLVLVAHHVVADGWSFRILFEELAADYAAALGGSGGGGEGGGVAEPPIRYADFALWQREQAAAGALEGAERYWTSELAGAEPVLELPSERRRPAAQCFDGGCLDLGLGGDLTGAVRRLAVAHRTTPFTVLLAAHALLLARLTGREDLLVAVPVSGRVRPETARVVGPFMNTLPIRVRLASAPTFDALVRQVAATTLRALEHQDVPFERIVELVAPPRDGSRSPLVQVMFQLEELPARRRSGGVDWSPELVDNRTSKLDLTLTMVDRPDELGGRLSWATAVLDEEEARDHLEAYRAVLGTAVARPEAPLAALDGLSPRQREAVTRAWADGAPGATAAPDLLDLLAPVPAGAGIAVSGAGGDLTHEALLDRAARIAATLDGLGVRPEQRVGLCLSRDTPMLAALIGVWWAGASYVPLDPAYPAERLRAMLTDADPPVVLTDEPTRSRLDATLPAGFRGRVTTVEAALATDRRLPPRAVPPEAAAYTIFTSGSTGRPKGVTVPRGAVAALVHAFSERLGTGPRDRLVALTTLSFDIAVLELLLPLATGGRVVVADEATASDPVMLRRLLLDVRATVLQATPATWRMLLTAGGLPPGLRLRLCGGEALPRDLADALTAPGTRLWNVYGPTETTVWSAAGVVAPAPAPVEVGPPIPGTRWYLLDHRMRPVPPGAVGEVHLGGAGVARGYLGRPGLTADRFRPDPYGGEGGRLYATGDLGRWRRSGRIELLGRADHQVKVRGFRIETEEVESVLRRHPGVADAVVVARPGPPGDPGLRLVGHVVPTAGMPSEEELRTHLAATVPDYMVPARFVARAALPRTPNGKVDRAALPDAALPNADWAAATPTTTIRAPGTPTERHLGRIWADLLGLHRPVGVDDSFFALGGHSLTASQLVARVHAELGVALPLRDLFTHPTIAGQAVLVDHHPARQLPERPPVRAAAAAAGTSRRGDLLAELDALDDDELGDLLQTLIGGQP